MLFVCNELVGCFELFEETGVVLGEHTEVGDAVLQVGDALDAHAEGIARVFLGVDAAELEHVGVDHTAAEDLHPAGVLAEATAFATTDEAGDVHLGRGLREGEVGGAQTDLGVGTEHLLGKRQQHLLEVGERDVLVDIQTFYLVEEAVCAGGDGLVTIDATRTDDADGGRELAVLVVHTLHDASLHAGGVRAQQDVLRDLIGMLADEEGVLHVAGGMVGSEVHLGEHVEVVFHLGTVGEDKAHT